MRALSVTAFVALIAVGVAAVAAAANPQWHPYHGVWGAPGLVFGLAGAAITTRTAAEAYCVRYERFYEAWSHYAGRGRANRC